MSNMVHDASSIQDEYVAGDEEAVAGTVRVGTDGMICSCPFCKRSFRIPDGSREVNDQLRCKRCGYRWVSRGGEPTKCPKCGSYAWNKPLIECRCNVCNYIWNSRKIGGPARCPNCKSNRWDEVPRIVTKEVSQEEAPEVKRKWVLSRYDSGEGCVEIASALGLPVFTVIRIVKESNRMNYLPRL